MRLWRYLFVVFLFSAHLRAAPPADSSPVQNIYIVRTTGQLHSPHVVNYRLVEWAQARGSWIVPDFGYYDTGYGRDQLWFAGIGKDLVTRQRFTWSQEVYFAQEAGPESRNQRSLWLWPVIGVRFTPRLSSETVLYPTLPLNRAQRWGFDIDRTKIEWAASPHWLAGAGYSSCVGAKQSWQHKPFFTATRKTHVGAVELWIQRISGGAQVQVRYQLVQGD